MRDLEFNLYLAQAPLRSDSQLTVMEKATELGVRGVYPILTDNCAVTKDVALKKQERWQRVMYEASKQCERAKIPTCYEPTIIENVIKKAAGSLLTNIEVFDVYTGENVAENEKSIAYSLTFMDNKKTLTEEEVSVVFDKIIEMVESKCMAKLRR